MIDDKISADSHHYLEEHLLNDNGDDICPKYNNTFVALSSRLAVPAVRVSVSPPIFTETLLLKVSYKRLFIHLSD